MQLLPGKAGILSYVSRVHNLTYEDLNVERIFLRAGSRSNQLMKVQETRALLGKIEESIEMVRGHSVPSLGFGINSTHVCMHVTPYNADAMTTAKYNDPYTGPYASGRRAATGSVGMTRIDSILLRVHLAIIGNGVENGATASHRIYTTSGVSNNNWLPRGIACSR